MSVLKHRITAVLAGSALVVGVGATGAVAGNLIGSADIRDGGVHRVDLGDAVNARIDNKATDREVTSLTAQVTALQAQVAALEAQDASGVNTDWVANEGAQIIDAATVKVQNAGTVAGSSVEILNLDLPVQATKTVEFTYELADGAVYGGGAPRVFLEIDGTYYNTFDADPSDAGVENSDGSFTKTWTIPVNGRVGNAGVVQDAGAGSITVRDLVISGQAISFQ
ncbi:MAG TPA: hypothetical protein VFY58_00670 [Nocardioides sp.]|nr:hypothetical protein [Nocardioides sp.]